MDRTIELDSGPITYGDAVESEINIINQFAYYEETKKLCKDLWEQRQSIEALTAHHLGLGQNGACIVQAQDTWLRGGFNICIPVEVEVGDVTKKVIFRCPMPHKLAEASYPGTVDEKIRCEVGTYAWMQENTPSVPIPHLFGFGFPDGRRHYTHATHRPFYVRFTNIVRRHLATFLRYPQVSRYTCNPTAHSLQTGYMILEFIGPSTGQMLSKSWESGRKDPTKRKNLYQGMARLILSLAQIPQPRIGSLRYHNNGTLSLSNRPLSCSTIMLENEGAPRIMQRSDTYTCTDAFVSEMLAFHDQRFLSQPNRVFNEEDCRGQMAVHTLLRTLSHKYIKRETRNGPFVLQFTDFHESNIFVDQEWNITCFIDLEWVCALPTEQLAVPYWLSGKGVDQIGGKGFDEFDKVRGEFMGIFEEEEYKTRDGRQHDISLAEVMHDTWKSKGVWFWHCIESLDAMYLLVERQLCKPFSRTLSIELEESLSTFWMEDSAEVVVKKLSERARYIQQLRELFDRIEAVDASESA